MIVPPGALRILLELIADYPHRGEAAQSPILQVIYWLVDPIEVTASTILFHRIRQEIEPDPDRLARDLAD